MTEARGRDEDHGAAKLAVRSPAFTRIELVSRRIDSDVLDWFKRQGKGYQTEINGVLRAYVRAHRR